MEYINRYLKIATHNVRVSMNSLMFLEYKNLGIYIIGITETKIQDSQSKYILKDNKTYKS